MISLRIQTNIGGIFISVINVQTQCTLNNSELFLKINVLYSSHLEQSNLKQKTLLQKTKKHGKVRLHLNINVRKEKENSLPTTVKMKTKIVFAKDQLNLWNKISTGAIAHPILACEHTPISGCRLSASKNIYSLLDNWQKNNHMAVDIK